MKQEELSEERKMSDGEPLPGVAGPSSAGRAGLPRSSFNWFSRLLKLALPLLLGAFILYWVYRDFDFAQAVRVLRHGIRWEWMALSLFFGVWSHVERALRWRQTLEPLGCRPRRSHLVDAVYLSYATSLVIPRVGEVSRCGALSRYDGVPFSKSLGTVVTERLVDTFCILLITGATLLLQLPVFVTFFRQTGTKIPSLVHLFTSPWFYVALFSVVGVVVVLVRLVRMLSFFERVRGVVLDVWQGVMSLRRVRSVPLFLLHTVLMWLCYFLHFYLTFYCFPFTSPLGVQAGLAAFRRPMPPSSPSLSTASRRCSSSSSASGVGCILRGAGGGAEGYEVMIQKQTTRPSFFPEAAGVFTSCLCCRGLCASFTAPCSW